MTPFDMQDNTAIGGARHQFPGTRWSAIVAARSSDAQERQRALGAIVAAYWKPVYFYIRMKWHKSNEDAKDLTQAFFARLLERDDLAAYDPAKAHFRTFLRLCLDRFIANEHKAAGRLKRGGGAHIESLDFRAADEEWQRRDLATSQTPDLLFEREWLRSLFTLALDKLQAHLHASGKNTHFALFQRHTLADNPPKPTYEQLASEFGLTTTAVTNYLALARREFRQILLRQLRELTTGDDEFRAEVRAILGIDLP